MYCIVLCSNGLIGQDCIVYMSNFVDPRSDVTGMTSDHDLFSYRNHTTCDNLNSIRKHWCARYPYQNIFRLGEDELLINSSFCHNVFMNSLMRDPKNVLILNCAKPTVKEAFWKHCWRKCGTNILIFCPTMFSTPWKKNCSVWATLKMSSANTFNLDKLKILSPGKALTISQTTSFWRFQTQTICRRQYQILWKWHQVLWKVKKKTRCVCETRMPPKRPFFEKCNLYIWPWSLQMTLTLVMADAYWWDVPSYQIWTL